MIDAAQNIAAGMLIVVGACFTLAAAIGVLRLPDFYTRMHAASKAGTVGSGLALIGLAIFSDDIAVSMRALAGVAFFLLTAPVSAHLLAKASYAAGYRMWSGTVLDDMLGVADSAGRKSEQRERDTSPVGGPAAMQ